MEYPRSHVNEDVAIGLCYYTTRGRHIKCRIKHGVGSFQVEEIIRRDILGDRGLYLYRIFKPWGVSSREVEESIKKYGARLIGRKDKYSDAWIHVVSKTRIYREGYTLVGRIDETYKPEEIHIGNRFRIRVLIPPGEDMDDVLEAIRRINRGETRVLNYYGYQRFGHSRDNHIHGYKAIRKEPPPRLERIKYEALQSYLFNLSINNLVRRGADPPQTLPLVGYATPSTQLEDLLGINREEALKLKKHFFMLRHAGYDFYGGVRNTYIRILGEISIARENEEAILEFILGRGEYATILLRELFKPLRPRQQGF